MQIYIVKQHQTIRIYTDFTIKKLLPKRKQFKLTTVYLQLINKIKSILSTLTNQSVLIPKFDGKQLQHNYNSSMVIIPFFNANKITPIIFLALHLSITFFLCDSTVLTLINNLSAISLLLYSLQIILII